MNWGTQLFLSKVEKETYPVRKLEWKLSRILGKSNIGKLIFWNTREDEYTDSVLRLCREFDVECWLWFPVLADSVVPSENARPAVNHRGEYGIRPPGSINKPEKGEENFTFFCPSDESFEELTIKTLSDLVDRYEYTGVFLDRIRYPSFANGLPLQYSCVCPACCRKMGIDSEALYSELDFIKGKDFLNLFRMGAECEKSSNRFPEVKRFFRHRMGLITEKVRRLREPVKAVGMGLALDLFTPALAFSVGQDYSALSGIADWIKPMTYGLAWGPAGIPLELDCLYRGLTQSFPELHKEEVMAAIEKLMNYKITPYWEGRSDTGFPTSLVYNEWNTARQFSDKCLFFPGIEMVHSELFRTKVPEYRVKEAIELFGNRTDIIACWNCLDIPESYFALLDKS